MQGKKAWIQKSKDWRVRAEPSLRLRRALMMAFWMGCDRTIVERAALAASPMRRLGAAPPWALPTSGRPKSVGMVTLGSTSPAKPASSLPEDSDCPRITIKKSANRAFFWH